MKILALDSTAKAASAALWEDEKVTAEFTLNNGLTHSEVLLPMAENICARTGITFSNIDYYAVTVGPGSFTGVRIGVAAVKGLAFRISDEPIRNCVAISTLEALAENLAPLDGILCPVMDARRGEVYNALFRMEGDRLVRLCPDRAISLASLAEELEAMYPNVPVRLSGDGYDVAFSALAERNISLLPTPMLLRTQNAASVAVCAARAVKAGEAVSDRALAPVYLRLPQAERDRLKKEQQKESEDTLS